MELTTVEMKNKKRGGLLPNTNKDFTSIILFYLNLYMFFCTCFLLVKD